MVVKGSNRILPTIRNHPTWLYSTKVSSLQVKKSRLLPEMAVSNLSRSSRGNCSGATGYSALATRSSPRQTTLVSLE